MIEINPTIWAAADMGRGHVGEFRRRAPDKQREPWSRMLQLVAGRRLIRRARASGGGEMRAFRRARSGGERMTNSAAVWLGVAVAFGTALWVVFNNQRNR